MSPTGGSASPAMSAHTSTKAIQIATAATSQRAQRSARTGAFFTIPKLDRSPRHDFLRLAQYVLPLRCVPLMGGGTPP